MAYTVPTSEPIEAAAGTTWKWERREPTYPPSEGWTLAYHIAGLTVLSWEAAWIANDGVSTFTVTIPPDKTAPIAPGSYRWVARAAKDGEVHDIDRGVLIVTADVAEATAGELQSHAERSLALIEAAIEGRIPSGMESATIGGRSISKMPLGDLLKWRGVYAAMVWRHRHPGQALPSTVIRFSGAA